MNKYLLLLLLSFSLIACNRTLHIAKIDNATTKPSDVKNLTPDAAIQAMITPYQTQLEAKMNLKVGFAPLALKKQKPESSLGNWVADLIQVKCAEYTKSTVDFAIVNYGGLRIPSIPAGDVSRGKLFELMPFDNSLVVVEITGETVQALFDLMAKNGGWPISKEVRYEINQGQAQNIMIAGKPLDNTATYRIGMSDYIANGGDRCSFLKGKTMQNTNVLFRDAMIAFATQELQKGQAIEAKIEGRVSLIDSK